MFPSNSIPLFCFKMRIFLGGGKLTSLICHVYTAQSFASVRDPCSSNPVHSVLADADKLFEQDLGALNRRMEKTSLLSNLGPYCKALCARRDFAIRRQLLKNDKVGVKAVICHDCGLIVRVLVHSSNLELCNRHCFILRASLSSTPQHQW